MNLIEKAQQAMLPIYEEYLIGHPFLKAIFEDKNLKKYQYAGFLVQIYHLIKHTPHFLAQAAVHCSEDAWLRNWYLDFAIDERGHDQLCLSDLRKMGFDANAMVDTLARPGATAMVANNYYIAQRLPAALIGFAMATEGMGANLAGDAANIISEEMDFGDNVCAFLRVHGEEDQAHYESVKAAFEKYAATEQQYKQILSVWEFTIINYSRLFTDSMESTTRIAI